MFSLTGSGSLTVSLSTNTITPNNNDGTTEVYNNTNYKKIPIRSCIIQENQRWHSTDKEQPISLLTIEAQSYFDFAYNGIDYTLYNSAPSLSSQSSANGSNVTLLPGTGTKIDIKNPHEKVASIIKIAANLQSTTIEEFKKYQKEDKKILNFLSGTNDLSNESKKIKDYISEHYLELTNVIEQGSTAHSTISYASS